MADLEEADVVHAGTIGGRGSALIGIDTGGGNLRSGNNGSGGIGNRAVDATGNGLSSGSETDQEEQG